MSRLLVFFFAATLAAQSPEADRLTNVINELTTLKSQLAETQAKIDAVKTRLIRDYGYCDVCATDTLNYVASIFARGDAR